MTFELTKEGDFALLERIGEYYPNDLKRKDKQKNSILHLAVKHCDNEKRSAEIVRWLIPKLPSSYINAPNFLGNTPLFMAVFDRKMECIEALYSGKGRARRPDPDHLNLNGRSVLMHCAMRDDVELIEVLLKHQPSPNLDIVAEKHLKTALSFAVEHNQENAARVLVDNGASFWIKDKRGKTVMDAAMMPSGNVTILRVMIDRMRVDVVRGCVASKLVRTLDVPDYLIAIIAQFVAAVPPEIVERERLKRAKKKRNKRSGTRRVDPRNRRGRVRGRGRGRRRGAQ